MKEHSLQNETILIKKLQSRTQKDSAFTELVNFYSKRLYWHIRNIVKNHQDADDVLQNTFIKVYRNIDSFKSESKLYSWMYRIATNESITHLNKNAKRLSLSHEELHTYLVENLQSDIYFDGDEIQLKLQQAIATLPQKQQLVFNMRYFENIKYSKMAEILKTSEGALKASYHLANKKIERLLTND